MTKKDEVWDLNGMLIIAASLKKIFIFGVNLETKEKTIDYMIEVFPDIGSYLSVMQIFILYNKNNSIDGSKDQIGLLVSTIDGKVHSYKLEIQYDGTGSYQSVLLSNSTIRESRDKFDYALAGENLQLRIEKVS